MRDACLPLARWPLTYFIARRRFSALRVSDLAGLGLLFPLRLVPRATALLLVHYFGWIQVSGVANVKMDGTPAIGTLVGASSNHAGQLLAVGADTTPALARVHGIAAVDNEFSSVFLMNLF